MIRSLLLSALALAGLAATTTAAQAQSATLYGLLDASGAYVKPVGTVGRYQLDSGDMQRSFVGFRGSEDLGGGLRAVFKLETYVRVDSGASGRADYDGFWSRESTVGLSGAFGTTLFGRVVTPLYTQTLNFNPFYEAFGFSPATRQYFGGTGAVLGDSRWDNAVIYTNNASDAPLRINFAANLPEKTASSLSTGRNFGGSVAYITGPFAASLAVERIRNSTTGLPFGFQSQLVTQAAATYDFKLIRIYGQVGRSVVNSGNDARTFLYQLGGAVPIGTSLILFSYGQSHMKHDGFPTTTNQIGSIGYDYFLSKNTDIYVAGLYERTTSLSSGHTLAGGLRLRF